MEALKYITFACCLVVIVCTVAAFIYDDAIEVLLDVKKENKVKISILSISVIILLSLIFVL